MAKKKNDYVEEFKQYAIVTVMILGVFIISFFFYQLYKDYENNKINYSYLVKKNIVKSYKIEDDLSEIKQLEGDYFLFISYSKSQEVYNLEKDIKSLIKEYKLQDKFYYIDINTISNSNEKINKINEYLGLDEFKVEKVPTIVYVNKDGEVKRSGIITRIDDNIMEKGDFQQLLDINGY